MNTLEKEFDLSLKINFKLTRKDLKQLIDIKRNKSYCKNRDNTLTKLENLGLIYSYNEGNSTYWFTAPIGDELSEKYSSQYWDKFFNNEGGAEIK